MPNAAIRGLGLFEGDKRVFLFKVKEGGDSTFFDIDYSLNGLDYTHYSNGSIINGSKLYEKTHLLSLFRIAKVSQIYLLTYKSEDVFNCAISFDLVTFRKVSKLPVKCASSFFPAQINGEYTLCFGNESIRYIKSSDMENWSESVDLYSLSVNEVTRGDSVLVSNVISFSDGFLITYFQFNGETKKYCVKALLVDADNPDIKIWDEPRIVWETTKGFDINAEPVGIVSIDGGLMSFWESPESGVFALSHLYFKNFEVKKTTSPSLEKFSGNPTLFPNVENEWESTSVFNPAAVFFGGKVHLVYRAVGTVNTSSWGYASSEDGLFFGDRQAPIYVPTKPFEGVFNGCVRGAPNPKYVSGPGWGGCEDPRLTKIDDTIYATYVAFDGYNPQRVALTSISEKDFLDKNWNWTEPKLMSAHGESNKNWVLFPKKINGKFALLHSITPNINVEYLDNLDFDDGKFVKSVYSQERRPHSWDSHIRGAGPPPIATNDGWLLFYHAMDRYDPGKYKVGAMVLDWDRPERILYRSRVPVIEPTTHYENGGLKPGVVFATGTVVFGDMLFVYYGGSDTTVNVAYSYLPDFLTSLKNGGGESLKVIC